MNFLEQMSVKALAHTLQQLGLLLTETLCVEPNPQTIRSLLRSIRDSLDEFEEGYFNDKQ